MRFCVLASCAAGISCLSDITCIMEQGCDENLFGDFRPQFKSGDLAAVKQP
jgi:hypothetical protein